MTAVLDGNQLMFTVHSFLSFLVGPNIAGTVKGSAIELQIVDSKGAIASPVFVQSSTQQFKVYADALKSKGDGIVLANKLLSNPQELREWNRKSENWIAAAQLHSDQIPKAEDAYNQIEDRMRSLISQERATRSELGGRRFQSPCRRQTSQAIKSIFR